MVGLFDFHFVRRSFLGVDKIKISKNRILKFICLVLYWKIFGDDDIPLGLQSVVPVRCRSLQDLLVFFKVPRSQQERSHICSPLLVNYSAMSWLRPKQLIGGGSIVKAQRSRSVRIFCFYTDSTKQQVVRSCAERCCPIWTTLAL